MITESIARLKKMLPFLEGALLQEIAEKGSIKDIKEDAELLSQGKYIKQSIILLDGLLGIYRHNGDGSKFLMYYLLPGEACAMSMLTEFDGKKSEVSAIAMRDSTVLFIPLEVAEQWLRSYQSWYRFVLNNYRERFEELLDTLDSVVFQDMDKRLLHYLQRHRSTYGAELRASHQQIADDLNTSREVISRLLKKLEQQGVVKLQRNCIELTGI